ncbi:MAG: hypothetical protein QXZ63_02775 [Sulfolobales archaeon]
MNVVVPLATRIHGPNYYRQLLKPIEEFFQSRNIKVLEVLDSEELIRDDILNIIKNSTPIFLILTGGTSRLAWKLMTQSNVRKAIIISHSEHNSLPSAISIRSRADAEGIPTSVRYCKDLTSSECIKTLEEVVELSSVITNISNARIAVVSDSVEDYYSLFESIYGIKLSLINYEELEGLLKEVKEDEARDYLSNLIPKLRLSDVGDAQLINAVRVYLAIKKLIDVGRFNALAIDCFPFLTKYKLTPCLAVSLLNDDGVPTACEADLRSLLIMLIVKSLGSWPVWIANISSISNNRIILAHCTIATKLGYNCSLVPHFESSYPYSLTCNIPPGHYTLASIDREFTTIATLKAKLIGSGSLFKTMCRTQAILETEVDLSNFANIALNNHHVLITGDLRNKIRDVAYMFGMDFITYESIIKYLSEV